ncbi:MAG: carbohydrate binding family 9 domain-containing protein [Candidatus Eisenbacteria bacterium]
MKTAMRWLGATCLVALLAASLTTPAGADDRRNNTPYRVPLVTTEVLVDGVLDEDAWERALVMGVNTEVRPGESVPALVETDMLMVYSETHFYVAFRAFDPDPSLIRARMCDRDRMWDDEWVVIGIDTYNDQRGGFEFACNPFGIQGDTANGIHGDGNAWDSIWDSAGRIFDWGYSVEMAIPFSTLRFQRTDGDQIWGVDAVRSYPRDVRHHIGLYAKDRDNNCYFCQMERLIGFEGAMPGRSTARTSPTEASVRPRTNTTSA